MVFEVTGQTHFRIDHFGVGTVVDAVQQAAWRVEQKPFETLMFIEGAGDRLRTSHTDNRPPMS